MVAPAKQFPYKNVHKRLTKKIQMLYNDLEFLGRFWVKEVECKINYVKAKNKNQMDRCTQYCFYRSARFYDQNGILQALSR